MNDVLRKKVPSTEEICSRIEEVMESPSLSCDEKEQIARRMLQIIYDRNEKCTTDDDTADNSPK